MKSNLVKILLAVLAVFVIAGAFGLGIVYARNSAFRSPFQSDWMAEMMDGRGGMGDHPGGMMGSHDGMMGSHNGMMGGPGGMMGGPGGMMECSGSMGAMHDQIWAAMAETLGLTADELTAEIESGKTLIELGEAAGLSEEDLTAALAEAHNAAVNQALEDGLLSEEQAGQMLAHMAGQHDEMLAHFGMGGGHHGSCPMATDAAETEE